MGDGNFRPPPPTESTLLNQSPKNLVPVVNMNKTKVMISGERQKVRQKPVRRPSGVCSKGVGSNSLQCNSCQKWVHKKLSQKKLNSLKHLVRTTVAESHN